MQDREDIKQDAIVRRLRSGSPIDRCRRYPERELYSGKEYGVAYHSSKVDDLRRRERESRNFEARKYSLAAERLNGDDPAKRSVLRESIFILREEMAQLPKREREVIYRCGLAGIRIQDFAVEQCVSERTAAALWHRAIVRLR